MRFFFLIFVPEYVNCTKYVAKENCIIEKELNYKSYILGEGPELSSLYLDCAINDDVEAEEHRLYTRYSLY